MSIYLNVLSTKQCKKKAYSRFIINGYVKLIRKEMFYLMTHSTHFIYGYIVSGEVNKTCNGP